MLEGTGIRTDGMGLKTIEKGVRNYFHLFRFFCPFVVEERIFRFMLRVTEVRGADGLSASVDVIITP
jgi:hypothetical protein